MPKCSLCSKEFACSGRMFVRGDGKIFWFCSHKCRKNFELGRESTQLGWIRKKKKY